MKIVITSLNSAKVNAVKQVFGKMFTDAEYIPLKVDSEVSPTPTSDDEAITGCINRIREAKRQVGEYDAIVSMEGLVAKNSFGVFVYGWCVVEFFENSSLALGCSARVKLPDLIAQELRSDRELSAIVQSLYPDLPPEQLENWGTNGVLTNGWYTRVDEFEDALICAIAPLSKRRRFV